MTLFEDSELDEGYTVSELNGAVAAAIRGALPRELWVRGEIRDLTRAQSGHVYFRLVEAGSSDRPGGTVQASISVMLSARNKRAVNATLKAAGAGRLDPGTQVKIRGRIDFYPPRGQVQLQMTAVDPIYTLGQLAAERAAVVERLRTEGVFDANRSAPMPLLPLVVGLVTSMGSDAERDVLHELAGSGIGFRVRCVDVRVQGDQAPATVASAIATLDGRVDVIVVARGGGGATDLQAFDSHRVARAICAASAPVLTGIGHERDVSVADEVAHESHKTPTAVAQALVSRVRGVHDRVESDWNRVVDRAAQRLGAESDRLERLTGALAAAARTAASAQGHRLERVSDRLGRSTEHALTERRHELDRRARRLATAGRAATTEPQRRLELAAGRLVRRAPRVLHEADETWGRCAATVIRAGRARVREADRRVASIGARLQLLDPATTLARGWSITRRPDGTIVRRADDLDAGDELHTTLADGTVTSRVE